MRLSICAVAIALLPNCFAGGPPKEILLGLGPDGKLKKPPGPVPDVKPNKPKGPSTKYFHEPGYVWQPLVSLQG